MYLHDATYSSTSRINRFIFKYAAVLMYVQAYWFMFLSAFPTGAQPALWGFKHGGTHMIGT